MKTFVKTSRTYHASNAKGVLVDLHMPTLTTTSRRHHWLDEMLGDGDVDKLNWLEDGPSFDAIVIDARGVPLRMVAIDPRIWLAHRIWLREKREVSTKLSFHSVVTSLLARELCEFVFTPEALPMLPEQLMKEAIHALEMETLLDDIFSQIMPIPKPSIGKA